ncbi:hypothetical protein [Streptomyces anandii]|uniref:hypothetical protein n=1 Tax=Streptomyces anandii TaxID=285454 RepID=UPI00378CE0B6
MSNLSPRAWFAGCAVATSALLLTACTSGSGDGEAANKTSSPSTASTSQAATGAQEKKLTDQAQTALASVRSGTMVEAGAERVTDGIHTEPNLNQGKTYKLDLVCIGKGKAQLTLTPASTGPKTELPCDKSVVQQRITVQKLPVRIDVDGVKGSTGVIAWQIDTV